MTPEDSLADLFADRKKHPLIVGRDRKMAWLGQVRLQAETGQEPEEYSATAAVWANSREDFDNTLRYRMVSPHLKLLRSEQVGPAIGWKGDLDIEEIRALISSLHEKWPIVFSELVKVEAPVSETAEPDHYLTISEHNNPPLPEQKGVPFWDKEWIMPELKALIFGQPDSGETVHTWLVVDAGLRKAITKIFDLDDLGVPVQCLFAGQAAKELEQVAPYLVNMSLPEGAYDDKDKVPPFHKDFFANHWGKGTGILVRSTASMEAMHRHFRKFTKIRDEKAKWYFLRFWEPKRTVHILQAFGRAWTRRFLANVSEIIVPGDSVTIVRLAKPGHDGKNAHKDSNAPFILSADVVEHLSAVAQENFSVRMTKKLSEQGLIDAESTPNGLGAWTDYFRAQQFTDEASIEALIRLSLETGVSPQDLKQYEALFQHPDFEDPERLAWFETLVTAEPELVHIRLDDGSARSTHPDSTHPNPTQ